MWRYKFLIAGAAIIAAAIGYGYSAIQAPTYQSNGLLLLNDPRTGGELTTELAVFWDPTRYIRNQVTVIQSPVVEDRAIEIMVASGTPEDDIVVTYSAAQEEDLDAVEVIGTGGNADQTTAIVNAVVEAYGEVTSEQVQAAADRQLENLEATKTELSDRITELQAQLEDDPDNAVLQAELQSGTAQLTSIDTQINSLRAEVALYGTGIQLFVPPNGPGFQTAPKPLRTAAIAFVLAALAAGAWAWWRSEQDQRADNKDRAAGVLGAPLLAAIPVFEAVRAWAPAPTVTHPDTVAAEAYHFGMSSLSFVLKEIDGRSVLITSPSPGDGKTTASLNLAVAAMKDGRSPLLIDGDERVSGLTRLAGIESNGQASGPIGVGVRWAITPTEQLDFIAAGRNLNGDTAGHFRSAEFRSALQAAMVNRDLVIIDAPPVMSASETADLAAEVDGVVLVITENESLRDVADARDRIALTGTPILGYIFNRATHRADGYVYGYAYGQYRDRNRDT